MLELNKILQNMCGKPNKTKPIVNKINVYTTFQIIDLNTSCLLIWTRPAWKTITKCSANNGFGPIPWKNDYQYYSYLNSWIILYVKLPINTPCKTPNLFWATGIASGAVYGPQNKYLLAIYPVLCTNGVYFKDTNLPCYGMSTPTNKRAYRFWKR